MKILILLLITILLISCTFDKKYYRKVTTIGKSNGIVQYESVEIKELETNKRIYFKEKNVID